MANTSPWEDLTEDITLPDAEGGKRRFRLREMTRVQVDKLTDLYAGGVEEIKGRAERLGSLATTVDLVKEAMSLQWDPLAPALQFILREPLDGREAPSVEWVRANLNERRATLLIEAQERLNGTEKFKKKAAKLATASPQNRAGSSLMIESPIDTADGPAKSGNDSVTDKPN